MKLLKIRPVNDFECVGVVANHCDLNKICIAEDEAITQDAINLFCGHWFDIEKFWKEVDDYIKNPDLPKPSNFEDKKGLIYGEMYNSCDGKKHYNQGVKKMLIYYTYSRYLFINQANDTATGFKYSNSDYASNIPFSDLKNIADKYRSMGFNLFKDIKSYICVTGVLPDWQECAPCGCGGNCKKETKSKGYGVRFKTISKN